MRCARVGGGLCEAGGEGGALNVHPSADFWREKRPARCGACERPFPHRDVRLLSATPTRFLVIFFYHLFGARRLRVWDLSVVATGSCSSGEVEGCLLSSCVYFSLVSYDNLDASVYTLRPVLCVWLRVQQVELFFLCISLIPPVPPVPLVARAGFLGKQPRPPGEKRLALLGGTLLCVSCVLPKFRADASGLDWSRPRRVRSAHACFHFSVFYNACIIRISA